jgi:hypothetical protein
MMCPGAYFHAINLFLYLLLFYVRKTPVTRDIVNAEHRTGFYFNDFIQGSLDDGACKTSKL